MVSFSLSLRTRSLALLAMMLLLTLTACTDTSNNTTNKSNVQKQNASISITIAGQANTESQLFSKLYTLMLHHAGFNVIESVAPGTHDAVFNAITSGHIDLYPEYTASGLAKLGLNSTGNAQQDYLQVKQGYEAKGQITWLDLSPLNDAYAICMSQAKASSLGVTKISDLTQKTAHLTMAATPDGIQYGVKAVKATYGLNFKKVVAYNDEDLAFAAVSHGTQDLTLCHVTSANIAKYKFVLLRDDKNASPVYNLAPIVRDTMLKKAPQIATILNTLAPYLTTQVSQQLQSEVVNNGKNITSVATLFLQSKGLL